ncbi:hypothetical protein ACN47E_007842 [Coniothyrium glycines]
MHFTTPLLALLSAALPATATRTNNTTNANFPLTLSYISATQAQSIISAASANATAEQAPQNIAVVDPSGLLVAFLRMDGALPGSIEVSQKKARTVVLTGGIPSGELYASVQPGAPLYGLEQTSGGLVVFGGGLPVYYGGALIGAVGVSGGSVEQDVRVATAGVQGLRGASLRPSS